MDIATNQQALGKYRWQYARSEALSHGVNRSVNGIPTTYTVNNLNEVTGYGGYMLTYDNNGNLVTNGATGCTYVYDDENRLVQWFVSVPQMLRIFLPS